MQSPIHHSLLAPIGAALVFAVCAPGPASAMGVDEARKLCAKNPKCKEIKDSGDFCIAEGNNSCKTVVACRTADGKCIVISIKADGGKKTRGSKVAERFLTGLKAASSGGPARPPGGGLLDDKAGFSSTGPAKTGTPAPAPAAQPTKIF
jgi:hypothetical protein